MIVLIPSALSLDERVMHHASMRFVQAFREAWVRIPEVAQAIIREYLQRYPGRVYLCFRMERDVNDREPWGRCHWWSNRTILTFLAPFVEGVQPLGKVAEVVAHELAHCYTRGNGSWSPSSEKEEVNVRHILKEWGFSEPSTDPGAEAAFDRWRQRHSVEFGEFTELRLVGC